MIILSIRIDSESLQVTLVFVVLVVFRSLMFLTSILIVFVGISRKSDSLKTKEQFCLLWNDSKLLVIALPYLLLSYTYFLYTLTTVINNSCIEDIQLYREVWLVLSSLLRFCKISFSIAYFMKIVRLVKKVLGEYEKDPDSTSKCCNRKRILYMVALVADPVAKPVGSGETNYHSNLVESQESYPIKRNLHAAKIESSVSNVDLKHERFSQSPLTLETGRYLSVDSEQFLDAANFSDKTETSSNILDGKALIMATLHNYTKYVWTDINHNYYINMHNMYTYKSRRV